MAESQTVPIQFSSGGPFTSYILINPRAELSTCDCESGLYRKGPMNMSTYSRETHDGCCDY